MERKIIVLILLSILPVLICYSEACPENCTYNWGLVWQDEFDGSELNKTKWTVSNYSGDVHGELQYYTPEDVYLENGNLVLRSQKRDFEGMNYSSGKVETVNKHSWTYGRFEMRAKLPKGQGIWPAFWLSGVYSWPPEIDFMELLGHDPTTVYMTNHWKSLIGPKFYQGTYSGPDFSADFHIFVAEWEPGEIRWYVDGVERFRTNEHVSEEPMYLILNTAVGGNWPGLPDNTTEFPQYYEIDYVRVYQKLECGNGVCEPGETNTNCSTDCYCGDGLCWIDEDEQNCPDDCLENCSELGGFNCTLNETCPGSWLNASDTERCCSEECQEFHRADTNKDGLVDMPELLSFLDRWKLSSKDVPIPELMEAIALWKSGQ